MVTGSTFSGNSASIYGGGISDYLALTVTDSTFSGNSASYDGGAVFVSKGIAQFTNDTFVGNTAVYNGAAYYLGFGELVMNNSIIARDSAASSCYLNRGTVSGANNLTDDTSCTTGFTHASSLLLGVLGDNGGPTQTVPLLPGSPAIDAGDDAICAAPR